MPQLFKNEDIIGFDLINQHAMCILNERPYEACNLLAVKITLNCIANSCLVIYLIDKKTEVSSQFYEQQYARAQELLSTLAYVTNKSKHIYN
jgi:hypothetical protein